ncbi:pyrroloquinoline quinone biosynthesis protein PqqF [Stutzerimonas stutzeri]|uniref:Coenzyme PQQ synthesis protein F n=1 Tax=Stutzerimonas stutzeri TaxID=316 RepID=A0A6I6LQ44_STUST|nr:pyrroloquinoline quinone biosynthesis protein PqqF [Stutzerimonas stutzeri]QGZ31310.1 pyrroloquinoline quinone biosynthesis protein PqqF [Stutzerimonas stutzeri]
MRQPSDPAERPSPTTLANGLRVRLLPSLNGSQAAALVRVHAGAHDAPRAYPGLAHFIEHLLFLGGRDYRAGDRLMPFVQGCGGQLNASTRERHTDFFFQVPAGQLAGAVQRLLDMLAHPLFDPSAQVREREVLHAEYRARAQDVETLCDAALSTAFDRAHPISGFHAGNRDTLPVEDAGFQHALRGFHQRFYRCGQIELLLAGPQDATELQRLAAMADATLTAGDATTDGATIDNVPPLTCNRDRWLRLQLENAQPRLNLLFALDGMQAHGVPALDHLASWFASEAPEGLAQRLRAEDLCQSVKVRLPYRHAGQGVVVIDLPLTEKGLNERALIVEAVLDWLRFLSHEARWQPFREEYLRVRRRSLQGAEPLARLRHWVEPLAWGSDSDEAGIREALVSLVAAMLGTGPLVLTVDSAACEPIETCGFPLRLSREPPPRPAPFVWHWQQPAANPWLQAKAVNRGAGRLPPALRWLGPEDADGQGALFLRWRFTNGQPSAGLWHALSHALGARAAAARQAGVTLRFEDVGDGWCLTLEGFAEAIPAIIGDLARLLVAPPAASLREGQALAERDAVLGTDEMPIRQLLQRMPRLLGRGAGEAGEVATLSPPMLLRHWQSAQWQGVATGFAPALSGALADAISALPGCPSATSAGNPEPVRSPGMRWHEVGGGVPMTETAVLLFCPLPARTATCEAAWRVLARLIEPEFFRRLRSELQLGYAVFSRFGQFGGHAGMLFAVQSPTHSAQAIMGHIRAFFGDFSATLAAQPAEVAERIAAQASEGHVADVRDLHARAEQAWQTELAGHDAARPREVASAMCALRRADLLAALATLRAGDGWVVVSNAAQPDAPDG